MIEETRKKIDWELETLLSDKDSSNQVIQAAKYMLFNQGKRIRPLITLSLLNDFGLDCKLYIKPTLPLELLHTASLIHDDLPALDDDRERRGKASCHVEFSEATAILTADYLQALAFDLLEDLDAEKACKLTSLYSKSYQSVCLGQQLDIDQVGDRQEIHRLKTAELFRACFLAAGIMCDLEDSKMEQLSHFSLDFGLFFQLHNDCLDHSNNTSDVGRSYSSDQKNKDMSPVDLDQARQDLDSSYNNLRDHFEALKVGLGIELVTFSTILELTKPCVSKS